jgi:hypothetical protein
MSYALYDIHTLHVQHHTREPLAPGLADYLRRCATWPHSSTVHIWPAWPAALEPQRQPAALHKPTHLAACARLDLWASAALWAFPALICMTSTAVYTKCTGTCSWFPRRCQPPFLSMYPCCRGQCLFRVQWCKNLHVTSVITKHASLTSVWTGGPTRAGLMELASANPAQAVAIKIDTGPARCTALGLRAGTAACCLDQNVHGGPEFTLRVY